MIISFGDKKTLAIWQGKSVKGFNMAIATRAFFKLTIINRAVTVDDLKSPPANHLEQLKGNLQGFYSIKINDQYRIIFKFDDKGASDVEITDYHK